MGSGWRARSEAGRGRAGRGQGPARHGGTDDDLRLGALRRPRAGRERRRRATARGARLRSGREDEPARVRLRDLLAEPALRHGSQPGCARPAGGRLERRLGRRDRRGRRRARARQRLRRARSGSRRRGAASSGSSRRTGSSRPRAASRSRRATTSSARWRRRSRAASGCCGLSHPGSSRRELESLEELEVGVAWLEEADPLVRERVEAAASLFPRRRELDLPLAPANRADFMREVADVHRRALPGERGAVRRERSRQGGALPRA